MLSVSAPAIGFKEWALVCNALGHGLQSMIIRKGGIAEGRDGFRFQHDIFFLFPTLFHEQVIRTTLSPETTLPTAKEGTVEIELFAQVEWTRLVTDPATVARLNPFHIWQPSVIEERFRYDEPPGVHVALLRVYRLSQVWQFADSPRFGGCRSWLKLPEPPDLAGSKPVLDDQTHAERRAAILSILSSPAEEG